VAAVTARLLRYAVLVVLGAFFLLPLLAMLEFSTRGRGGGGRELSAWRAIGDDRLLLEAILTSLQLAVLTSVLMLLLLLPTMVWVHLRVPRLRRLVEFLCLLPLVIPAVVLVVGIAPLFSWVTYFLGDSALTLTFVYAVLVLPYAFRALESGLSAMDLRTLSEAARSLGAGRTTVLLRVVLPGVRGAVLSAVLLTVALVLGEYTLASLLNFVNLQVAIAQIGLRDAALSIAVSLAALLLAFALLLALSLVSGRRRTARLAEPVAPAPRPAEGRP
jgi:putative spermidine/putrescine transport system permease protein